MKHETEGKELNHYLKILIKSSFFIFIATVISKLASYGYKILLARSFGAEIYGLFSLALIIISIAASIATLGLGDGIVRYISFYRGKNDLKSVKKLVNDSKNIFLVICLLGTLVLILLTPYISANIFHSENFTPIFIGMVFAFPFILLTTLYLSTLRGFEKIKTYSSLVNIYQNSTRFALLGILILAGVGEISISISYVVMFVGLYLLARFYSKKELDKVKITKKDNPKKLIREALSYSWPLLFVGIFYSIFYWTDSLFIGYFTNAENVGWYSSAITIVSLFGIAPDLFMQLFFPLISFKLSEGKREIVKKITKQVTKWIYILNLLLFILIFLFSEHWTVLLFGEGFLPAADSLRILSIGAIFTSIAGISTNLLSAKGKTKLVLTDFIIFTLINIVLNFLLIPKYGLIGAAFATLISQVLFIGTLATQVNRMYGFNLLRFQSKKLVGVTVMLLIIGVYLTKNVDIPLAFSFVLSLIILITYFVFIYLSKVFDEEDFSILKAIVLKIKKTFKK